MPRADAERLLLSHWEHLRYSPEFIQAALYVATPTLLDRVRVAVDECPDPFGLFEYLSQTFGVRVTGHPGLRDQEQLRALTPYLEFLSETDIGELWEGCNEKKWFSIREELLDSRLAGHYLEQKWDRLRAKSRARQDSCG
jgi:hypothetical protein